MTSYTEDQLIFPSLKIINNSKYGIPTSELIKNLREELQPNGEDLKILINRNDDKFSQKVRNLRSHKTLEKLGFVILSNDGKYRITGFGKRKLYEYENKHFTVIKKNVSKNSLIHKNIMDVDIDLDIKEYCEQVNINHIYELILKLDRPLGVLNSDKLKLKIIKYLELNNINLESAKNESKLILKNLNSQKLNDKTFTSEINSNDLLKKKISDLELSERINNVCKSNNIVYLYVEYIL